MKRIAQLHVRSDWGFIKFAYLPLVVAGAVASKLLWPALAVSFRCAPCGICALFARWTNHIEEWVNVKPVLAVTDYGLLHEDGGEPCEYSWEEILAISLHRRNDIPPWRTNGSAELGPPFWLAITVRDPNLQPQQDVEEGYTRPYDWDGNLAGTITITAWPRQVEGGLMALARFAKTLQFELVERATSGAVPSLLASDPPGLAATGLTPMDTGETGASVTR